MEKEFDFKNIGKQMPYRTPDGFFDRMQELNIQQRFFDKEGKTKMNYVRTLVFPLEQAGEFKSKISNLKVYKK